MSPRGKGSYVYPSWRVRVSVQDANPQDRVLWLEVLVQSPPSAPWKAAEPQLGATELLLHCMERIKGVSSAAGNVLAFHAWETMAGMEGEISHALLSLLCFSGSISNTYSRPSGQKQPASHSSLCFYKTSVSSVPHHFSLFCTDVVLRDYAVD